MPQSNATTRILLALSLVAGAAGACARRPDVAPPGTTTRGSNGASAGGRRGASMPDFDAVYQRMGLVVGRGDLPFAATTARFATTSSDSALVLFALSLANRALTFEREGDRYRAAYEVRVELRRAGEVVRRLASDETVRVATFRETARTDESVLFRQTVVLAPGTYTLAVAVRDVASGRSTSTEAPLVVTPIGPTALSTPVVVYDATPRTRLDTMPALTPRPRATAAFGTDVALPLYVERYGDATSRVVRIVARGERNALLWSDTATLARQGAIASRVLRVPVAPLGIGVVSLDVVAQGAPNDSARVSAFVSLGEDLPITTFDDALSYLRFYASEARLRRLREASPETRPAAWAAFLRESDPSAATPEHEGLRDYFARIRSANLRFGEEDVAGWTTDRGMTYVVLGEPDQIVDPASQDPSAKGREQIWEYRGEKLQLTFVDRSGFGRWRLNGQSAALVQQAMRRRLVP